MCPCMFPTNSKSGRKVVKSASRIAAQRSGAAIREAAGGRSIVSGCSHTATKLDRRRSGTVNPNSRQSRTSRQPASSSHRQDRSSVMDAAPTSSAAPCVGIDIAKDRFDAKFLPENRWSAPPTRRHPICPSNNRSTSGWDRLATDVRR